MGCNFIGNSRPNNIMRGGKRSGVVTTRLQKQADATANKQERRRK